MPKSGAQRPVKSQRKKKASTPTPAQQVYRHIPMIQLLTKMNKMTDPAIRRLKGRVLQLSPDTVRVMGNITLNALNDRIPMTAKQKKELQRLMPQVKTLASPRGSITNKSKVIQEGGFLPLIGGLLPAIASTIGSALFETTAGTRR